jgi:hypothetical protein
MDFFETLKQKGKCCISEKPLDTTQYVNLVNTEYLCTWPYPFHNNVLIPAMPKCAIAAVHDESIKAGKLAGPIKFVIEIKDDQLIYHPVEALEKYVDPFKN